MDFDLSKGFEEIAVSLKLFYFTNNCCFGYYRDLSFEFAENNQLLTLMLTLVVGTKKRQIYLNTCKNILKDAQDARKRAVCPPPIAGSQQYLHSAISASLYFRYTF